MRHGSKSLEDKYDVIIIGAGIGGLTCGCYLVREGMKVLIVEQHNKPGGCCSSFRRKGVNFDAAVHTLATCRKGGLLGQVLDELELRDQIKFTRRDPLDIIITKDYEIYIKPDLDETIDILCNTFPREAKNINNFFRYIDSLDRSNYHRYLRIVDMRFGDLLQSYFNDKELITLLSILLLYTGVPSYDASALVSVFAYNQFLDGGYYPIGGMQGFSDTFAAKFIENGGMLLLSAKAEKIEIENREVKGVRLRNSEYIRAKYVISNCDARHTYFDLIGQEYLSPEFKIKINGLVETSSFFAVCLGLNRQFQRNNNKDSILWYFPRGNINAVSSEVFYDNVPYLREGVICIFSPKSNGMLNADVCEVLYVSAIANYKNYRYWKANKEKVAEELINRAEKIFPGISSSIVVTSIITPYDIEKYTLNYRGAMNGWACIPEQVSSPVIRRNTKIKRLYMVGHWVNESFGGGVSTVANTGRNIAKLIQQKEYSN
ncbi:MAG: phytoene desaturase family protein [bacterium]